jgi:hypothetical protein
MVVAETFAGVNAAVNVVNFAIGQQVNQETDSVLLTRLEQLSRENAVLGPVSLQPIVSDSPMVQCLVDTVESKENAGSPGIAYVFFNRQSQGKSTAARMFCKKYCTRAGHRSILVSGSGVNLEGSLHV